MTYVVPAANWLTALAELISNAAPGDTLQVDSESKAELARRAMERMKVAGLSIVVQPRA